MRIRFSLKDDVKNVLILKNELLNHKNVSKVAGGSKLTSNNSESNLVAIKSSCSFNDITILSNQNKSVAASLKSSNSLCNTKRTFSAMLRFKCPDMKEGLKPFKKNQI